MRYGKLLFKLQLESGRRAKNICHIPFFRYHFFIEETRSTSTRSEIEMDPHATIRNPQARADELQERLINFAVRVIGLSAQLPKTPAGRHIAGQILRSGTSPAP